MSILIDKNIVRLGKLYQRVTDSNKEEKDLGLMLMKIEKIKMKFFFPVLFYSLHEQI